MIQHFWVGASATSKNCRGENSISGQGDFSDVQTENPLFPHKKVPGMDFLRLATSSSGTPLELVAACYNWNRRRTIFCHCHKNK